MAVAAPVGFDMMDNRKRPHEAGPPSFDTPAKRLQVDRSPSSSSPGLINGTHSATYTSKGSGQRLDHPKIEDEDDEEDLNPAYKGLETYRKEAIFRQMREAQRDMSRASQKVTTLQRSLAEVEERTEAFNHFWDLLVEDVNVLFAQDGVVSDQRSALSQVIPFTAGQPSKGAFSASVQERTHSVRAVLTQLASVAPKSTPEVAELQARCHQMAEEASQLRSRQSKADEENLRAAEELKAVSENLRRAERRIDRLQSRSVLLSERPQAEEEAEKAKIEAAEAERKAAEARKAAAEATDDDSSHLVATNGHDAISREEVDQLETLAQRRSEENSQLRSEVTLLRQECERLQLELHRIPDDRTRETRLYRDLHGHFTHAQQELERFKGVYDAIEAENVDLREGRMEFQASAQKEASAVAESLREQLKGRDADVARLRAQRDDANAEISDRRQREGVKLAQCDEMKQLVSSKDLRIETLRSEIRRLQLSLAAQNGLTSVVESLKASDESVGEVDDVEMIAMLSSRLKDAEQLSADLKRQLDARSSSTSDDDLLGRVSSLQNELDQITKVLQGATSESDVTVRLSEQQQRIQQMQNELTAANESTNALCEEVEKLSRAYAEMDKQASSKVVDLSKMEDKVLRLTTEKAKADNKYFAAMRAKDAVDNDRRAVLRTVERQISVIERYAEAEQQFTAHLASHEREVTALRKMTSGYAARIAELERDLMTSRMRESEGQQHRKVAEDRLQAVIAECEQEKAQRSQTDERFAKMERDLEKAKRQAAQAVASSAGNGVAGGGKKSASESEVEFLQALLRCSSCKDRYRDRIVAKCKHTFCAECLRTRIETRQRKCPHCGIPFAVSDVQPLYFQ